MRFGPIISFFSLLTSYFKVPAYYGVLLSMKEDEWESAYSCAKGLLSTKPKQLSDLGAIYGNPEKYAEYYLRSLEGNL
jgi:hypothetical protein